MDPQPTRPTNNANGIPINPDANGVSYQQLLEENRRLRAELERANHLWERDRELARSLVVERLPRTEAEWREHWGTNMSIKDIIKEVEAESHS